MIPLPPAIKAALNKQMNLERLNEAYYDALASQMEYVNFDGSAKFFTDSAREEHKHYDAFRKYLIDRNENPALTSLDTPLLGEARLLTAFQSAQEREALTTQSIDALYDLAEETGDNATCTFLIPYVDEQTHSERELMDIVTIIKRAGPGLGEQWVDHEIGEGEIPVK